MFQILWAYKNVTPVRELADENPGKISGLSVKICGGQMEY